MAGDWEQKHGKGLGSRDEGGDAWLNSESEDEFEALAELFLGESGDSPATVEEVSSGGDTALIEALVLGHLPVRAGPWVVQYAHATAQQTGKPVALVRFVDGQVLVDLLGLERGGAPRAQPGSLGEALRTASGLASRWIVHVDELHEPALASDLRIGAVTILAGANNVAVVAAYRALKEIFLSRKDASGGGDAGAPIRVAIMGAEQTQANAAIEKIQRASQAQLQERVGVAACVERMGPTGSVVVYRGRAEGETPRSLLDSIEGAARGCADRTEAGAGPEAPQAGSIESAPGDDGDAWRPTREELEALHSGIGDGPLSDPPAAPVMPGVDGSPPMLESFIRGLQPFEARCPDEESVRLAIDHEGALHLLRYDTDGRGIEPLVAVEAWARKHHRLLGMAAPATTRLRSGAPVRMHLFTDSPKRVRHLLDGRAAVHILAPVRVGGQTGWYCTEMN